MDNAETGPTEVWILDKLLYISKPNSSPFQKRYFDLMFNILMFNFSAKNFTLEESYSVLKRVLKFLYRINIVKYI